MYLQPVCINRRPVYGRIPRKKSYHPVTISDKYDFDVFVRDKSLLSNAFINKYLIGDSLIHGISSLTYRQHHYKSILSNGSLINKMHSVYEILIRVYWLIKEVPIMRVIYSLMASNNSLALACGMCFKRGRSKYPPNLDWLAPSATRAFRIELMHNVVISTEFWVFEQGNISVR